MTTCKHCGTEFSETMGNCPNCGQRNTDYADESYLDSLLNSVTSGGEKAEERFSAYQKADKHKKEEPETEPKAEIPEDVFDFGETDQPEEMPADFFADAEDDDLLGYNIFDDLVNNEELDQMIEQELTGRPAAGESGSVSAESVLEEMAEKPVLEELTEEQPLEAAQAEPADEEGLPEQDASVFDGFTFDMPEELPDVTEKKTATEFSLEDNPFTDILDENDIVALDDLFQSIDAAETAKESQEGAGDLEQLLADDFGADELLAAHEISDTQGKKGKNKKADGRSLAVKMFGNVPLDPSKIKHEPTPEEIEAEKKEKAEKKKQSKEEKKAAAAEKKAAAKQAKEEKARQKQLEKEEKKAKKMEQAKLILEDVQDTRINRVGAAIIFIAFAMIALILIVGSNMVTYNIAVQSAEKSFHMALNNSVSYYNDAYDHIYGLELKDEDIDFGNKVMMVMYVNKQLNSYNSFVAIGDEVSALDSLLKGIYRYEKWSIQAGLMGYNDIMADLDYVCSQILLELDKHYGVTLDEATALARLIGTGESFDYSKEVYKIIDERIYGRTEEFE